MQSNNEYSYKTKNLIKLLHPHKIRRLHTTHSNNKLESC